MSFYLRGKETVGDGIKRIVNEEIAQAIKDVDNPKLKRIEAIHEFRKRCKKIRSVLGIVRPQFEETYEFENAWFRDAAKGLAALRDAEAIIETYDSLLDKFSDQIDRQAFAPVRRAHQSPFHHLCFVATVITDDYRHFLRWRDVVSASEKKNSGRWRSKLIADLGGNDAISIGSGSGELPLERGPDFGQIGGK